MVIRSSSIACLISPIEAHCLDKNQRAGLLLMKSDIHPKYYTEAKVHCACGNAFTIGSTKQEISLEICSKCHPFYTGSQQLIDTAGRVERFKARQKKAKIGVKSKTLGSTKKTKSKPKA